MTARTGGDSLEWFEELEKKITAVASEMADLRKKNRSLLARAQRLEREAKEGASGGGKEWEAERKRVRAKAESLNKQLEKLLQS